MESRVRRYARALWWACAWVAVIAGPYVAYAYLWASLGMVAFRVPAAIIGMAVALHKDSTPFVVANALRLPAYKDR